MKIAFIIPAYLPALDFGGPVNVLRSLVKILKNHRHVITIYTTNMINSNKVSSLPRIEYLDGVLVKRYNILLKIAGYWMAPSMFHDLMNDDFDLIHAHCARSFQLDLAALVSRIRGKPLVITAHGAIGNYKMMDLKVRILYHLHNIILKISLNQAKKLIALNNVEIEQYKSRKISEEKIEVIPNGIDLSEYDNLPAKGSFKKKFFIKDDEKLILYVGRIHKEKGLDLLIKAINIVFKKLDRVKLVIVGPDDGYASSLSELLYKLEIVDKVIFTGFINKDDKMAAFLDSDVFVTPTFRGFPITFLEAMFTGTPIITTIKGDNLKWIHRNIGIITEYSDVKLAYAILEILQDKELKEKYEKNCKLYIKKYDISNNASILERIYNKIIID